jgi:uncharacterized membrane protein (UPF0182 family)
VGTSIAASAAGHWQTFLLWRHRQPFGVVDPMSGKDVGFFVFSLPFQLEASRLLLVLVAVAVVSAVLVYLERGALTLRPLRVTYEAQVHLGVLAAALLLALAWRFRLERYVLELGSPRRTAATRSRAPLCRRPCALARARGAVDPLVVSALACVVAPHVARRGYPRRAGFLIGVPAAVSSSLISFGSWLPALVQRFAVDPNPLSANDRSSSDRSRRRGTASGSTRSTWIRIRRPAR